MARASAFTPRRDRGEASPIRRVMIALVAIGVMVLLSPTSYAGGSTPGPDAAAGSASSTSRAEGVPADVTEDGMVYRGLRRAGKGECNGDTTLYVVGSSKRCTHGPDPAPPGVDPKKPVKPLSPDATVHPEALCVGDGQTGMRTQVMYVRASDVTDRYATFAASIRQWANDADGIYLRSAQETGGVRNVRFVHDAGCNIIVANVVISAAADDDFGATINALAAAGYNRTDRKYMIFADANIYCGIGTVSGDTQPGPANASNTGPSYGRSDNGCWTGMVAGHEHMHNLGGVNLNAPNTSNGYHCIDEYDVMCYSDSPDFPTMIIRCPDTSRDSLYFDCNHDDYYHTNPPAGSYLATNWNTANANALTAGGVLRTVSGVVRGPSSGGNPGPTLNGAKVTIPGVGTATTNSSGAYSLAGVQDGTYSVTARWGCYDQTQTLVVNGNETLNFALTRRNDPGGFTCTPTTFSYINASTALSLTGDDASATVALPFPFRFQGVNRTTGYVSTNGVLNFLAADTSYNNTAVPNTAAPNAAIYAYWDDLAADATSSIRTQVLGSSPNRRFVVEWRNVYLLADPTRRFGFEIILYEDDNANTNDQFRLQYTGIDAGTAETGTGATIGWENNAGNGGLQYSLNQGNVSNNLALQVAAK